MENKNLISVKSVTQALKIKDYLTKKGIRSQLIKTPGGSANSGCGYSLYVPKNYAKAVELIKSGGVM